MQNYKERIRELRLNANLSQRQVAEVLGVKQQQYQRWETGNRDFPIKELVQLANFFGVTTDYILLGKVEEDHEQNEQIG